ncbi:MAG: YfhO family protein [Candidatus Levybacteria bacterium]|nr:YfhO family protein [Candidatus Levybacteria bacterium]
MRKFIQVLLISFVVFIFFWQFFFKGLFPIPSDTIIGLYHPFRDFYAKDYPNGIPFKNFLVTDPVRQQLPWRDLSVSTIKNMELPLWNPYNFSGTPLLANFQSAPFYMLNILFFIMPFATAWSAIIFLGPLLAGVFLYLYLANLNISKWASLLGAFTFSFSGFFVAWLEWGTITHVGLWLPLILLSIDKLVSSIKYQK